MDARLTSEQELLRDAAAKLAADLGPGSVRDLDDADRRARLEQAVAATGWRTLRSDGASGVEVALVAEEFGRGLVDVPFIGPVLADEDLLAEPTLLTEPILGADLTGATAGIRRAVPATPLALVATTADILGAARGAHALAVEYAKVRAQYGRAIGSYQGVSHPLAEGLALIEGGTSVLRYAAWAVDEEPAAGATRAATIAKLYCARAARTICETAIQVHGGIGNTWECLAHVYLRRVLVSAEIFPVTLEDISLGLP